MPLGQCQCGPRIGGSGRSWPAQLARPGCYCSVRQVAACLSYLGRAGLPVDCHSPIATGTGRAWAISGPGPGLEDRRQAGRQGRCCQCAQPRTLAKRGISNAAMKDGRFGHEEACSHNTAPGRGRAKVLEASYFTIKASATDCVVKPGRCCRGPHVGLARGWLRFDVVQ